MAALRWLTTHAQKASPVLRTAGEVRAQIAATSVFMSRHTIEHLLANNPKKQDSRIQPALEAVQYALQVSQVERRLSDEQRRLLAEPAGSWSTDSITRYTSLWETQGVLLWAIHRLNSFPKYFVPFERVDVFKAAAIQPADVSTIFDLLEDESELLSPTQLLAQRDRAEAWHWRAKAYHLQQLKKELETEQKGVRLPPGLRNYLRNIDTAVSQAAIRACTDGLIEYTCIVDEANNQSDFPVEDRPYKDLTHDEWRLTEMIADGRLAALGWLLGSYSWDLPANELTYASPMAAMFAPTEEISSSM